MDVGGWVRKKLLSDKARQGGASAAALKAQEAEEARKAAEEAERKKAEEQVQNIKFKAGGSVRGYGAARKPTKRKGM